MIFFLEGVGGNDGKGRLCLCDLLWMWWGTSERFHLEQAALTLTFCDDHSGVREEIMVAIQTRDPDGLGWGCDSSDCEKKME